MGAAAEGDLAQAFRAALGPVPPPAPRPSEVPAVGPQPPHPGAGIHPRAPAFPSAPPPPPPLPPQGGSRAAAAGPEPYPAHLHWAPASPLPAADNQIGKSPRRPGPGLVRELRRS